MQVDVRELECDFLSGTARKFLRGPRGVGFLYASDRALEEGLEPLFVDMRGADWTMDDLYQPAPDAKRFETWEFAYALVLGMGAAVRYALDVGVEQAAARAWELARTLRDRLAALDGVRVLDRGAALCAIVTIHVAGQDPAVLVRRLRERGINTSSVDRTSAVIDFDEKGVEGALRISPHYYNTEEEVDVVVEALKDLV
jgi:selenocysteine lyase/cysteine desulfurase